MGDGIPAAEVEIDVDLVRSLLLDQHRDLADLPLRMAGEGWDNVHVRIGDRLAARMPRREVAAPLAVVEQRWLPILEHLLPLPVPAPRRAGRPGHGYPWRWSIVPWFEGVPADQAEMGAHEAEPLAHFLAALHLPAPGDAPTNEWRGIPLARRRDTVEGWLDALSANGELTKDLSTTVRGIWARALAAPIDVSPTWLHGDLHPRNVVLAAGRIAAIVDWGDLCVGDRATDLAAVWTLLPSWQSRVQAIEELDSETKASAATWARARGWAVFFGAVLLKAGLDDGDRTFAAAGLRTLERLAADEGDARRG